MTANQRRNLLKTIPGFAISAFFLWFTFRNVKFRELMQVRLVAPVWILVAILFLICGYTLRAHRWWIMMRASSRAKFSVCMRVLMTSFAANNIMPLRVGDFLRFFSYAKDLDSTPAEVLSTVILERVLDMFALLSLFILTPGLENLLSEKQQFSARVFLVVVSVIGLAMLLAANALKAPLRGLLRKLPHPGIVAKIESLLISALDAVARIHMGMRLFLVVETAILWACEGVIFVSIARLLGVVSDPVGPWQALAYSNLSYLIPSSPGAVGTFEYTAKSAMVVHGANEIQAVAFSLVVHVFILFTVTAAGGIMFLVHRSKRGAHPSLPEELEQLPVELPPAPDRI